MSKNPVPRGQPIQLTKWSCRKIPYEGVNRMKTTIDMAREAGFQVDQGALLRIYLERFEALVRADEREACAKVCDDLLVPVHISLDNESLWEAATLDCADAIRARGETE
jgi:hypothetical protein